MDRFAIVSTVKAPMDQILKFVNYHLNIGFDQIVLFFDDPKNEGIEILEKYDSVTTVICSDAYWKNSDSKQRPSSIEERQLYNLSHGINHLSISQCDWLVHIDVDELVHCKSGCFKKRIIESKADAVRFSVLEAVSEQVEYDHIFLPTLYKVKPRKTQIKLARLLGCSKAIYRGEYFRGHTASKMAVNLKVPRAEFGIHGVTNQNKIKVINSKTVNLLHFDCVGMTDWKVKWDRRIDGSGTAINMRDNREEQLNLYKKAKNGGELKQEELFFRMHGINKKERVILRALGMLTKVFVNKELFNQRKI